MKTDDFITREDAKKKHCEICMEECVCYRDKSRCDELKAFDSIPAADVREVVMCRDCCMYECHEYDGGLKHVCELFKRQMQEADFCSYGEKREES